MVSWGVLSNCPCPGCILYHMEAPNGLSVEEAVEKVFILLRFIKCAWRVQGRSLTLNSAPGVDGREADVKPDRSYTRT